MGLLIILFYTDRLKKAVRIGGGSYLELKCVVIKNKKNCGFT